MPDIPKLSPRHWSVPAVVHRCLHRALKIEDPKTYFQRFLDPAMPGISVPARINFESLLVQAANGDERRMQAGLDWLMRHGEPMYQGFVQPEPLPNRHCWWNSFRKTYRCPDHGYVEGLVTLMEKGVDETDAYLHGWNLHNGHVVDATWGKMPRVRYSGVVFSEEFLRFCGFMTGYRMELTLHYDVLGPYLENYGKDRLRLRAMRRPG